MKLTRFALSRRLLPTLFISLLPAIAFGQLRRPDHVEGRLLVQRTLHARGQDAVDAVTRNGARLEREIPELGVYVLSLPEAELQNMTKKLNDSGLFTYAEPDGVATTSGIPNDPLFSSQWHLTAINAPAAWNLTDGSTSVKIAMIDSGVNPTHPDLAAKLLPGWSVLLSNSNTADTMGHGTATAGTAAAATNDGIGVAGVGWMNPILPVVVVDSTGSASYSNIAAGITWAVNNGARIINVSIGGTTASSTLQSAVTYAWNKGAVVFAAAGNNASSAPMYPAACEYAVAVSATEPGNTLASFSNYGSWIDLAAPGDGIYTTDNTGSYSSWYGTSFSSPIAAGVGALALSINPGLTAQGLVTLLEQNADDIGTPGFDNSFGWGLVDAYKVALAAGSAPPPADTIPPSVTISSPASGATVSGTVQIAGAATDNVGVASVQLYVDGALNSACSSLTFLCSWNASSAAAGSHTITVEARDAAGNIGSASVTLNIASVPVVVDTVPPIVSIKSPANGATVSGNVAVSVAASDNVGVTQVSIDIDNVLTSTLTASPYSWQWNTKKYGNGSHTVKATAWDAAGNNASASITVKAAK